jgi:cobaltochelatase CobN
MHLLVRETHSLDAAQEAVDLAQWPADIVFLSFSDSDLGAAAAAWSAMTQRPSLRLANLAQLRHPMSVDLYLENTVAHARCVVVRLLGGVDYWRYGVEELSALCRALGIALAIVPGDGRDDARLAAFGTVDAGARARIDACLVQGGADNLALMLAEAAHLGGLGAAPDARASVLPDHGEWPLGLTAPDGAPLAVVVFYRAWLLAADTAPIAALARALDARGLVVRAAFVPSLKAPEAAAFLAARLRAWRPAVVLNATAFAARAGGEASPLDAADAPVLQVVLAGSTRAAWDASARGLSQADLAMQVVLPELDGRLLSGAISFKAETAADPALQYARMVHAPDADGIALAADRAAGWARLAATPRAERRIALVLPRYPDLPDAAGHAVGLDVDASVAAVFSLLGAAGYGVRPHGAPEDAPALSLAEYARLAMALPEAVRAQVAAAWGAAADDPAVAEGRFMFRFRACGNMLLAVQPERGDAADRRANYHDPALPPRHAYVAFHLWLREAVGLHALVQFGTHGTLEWLPGKAAALSAACFPQALTGGLPVIYPYLVTNPGEAAAAKRRIGAVTLGHLPPPLAARAPGALERLIDEYGGADGLDARRSALLRTEILAQAEATEIARDAGITEAMSADERIARIDDFVCAAKALRLRDGLHVFARGAPGEAAGLLAALDGRFVPPGPAGAPSRGRADVLPTGRNLFAIDPRAVPTRSAVTLAERTCAALLRRHAQDQGEALRSLVIDVWGSATMRTGGEDVALALLLLGVRPTWDEGTSRVGGFEVVPLALLDRPRVDVTLRISGLFRDAFPHAIELFDAAVRAVAARDEAADWNPLAGADDTCRVYGCAPGAYGTGVAPLIARGADRAAIGAAYLAASATGYGAVAADGFAARVAEAGAFLHVQDHAETDALDGPEYAAHAGGFAAAAAAMGAAPALYHGDTATDGAARVVPLATEIAAVVRGKATDPAWVAGQMRHGRSGAIEIGRAAESLFAFAASLPARFDRQFDLLHAATLGDAAVAAFLREASPAAHDALAARFAQARARGLWHPRRNDLDAA